MEFDRMKMLNICEKCSYCSKYEINQYNAIIFECRAEGTKLAEDIIYQQDGKPTLRFITEPSKEDFELVENCKKKFISQDFFTVLSSLSKNVFRLDCYVNHFNSNGLSNTMEVPEGCPYTLEHLLNAENTL